MFLFQNLQGRIAALYLPLISVLLENNHRVVKSDEQSPAHAPTVQTLSNGDAGSVKGESTKSTSSGHTPVSKHKSVISLPQPQQTDPSKRDSSVFDMIAGTKSKYTNKQHGARLLKHLP